MEVGAADPGYELYVMVVSGSPLASRVSVARITPPVERSIPESGATPNGLPVLGVGVLVGASDVWYLAVPSRNA